MTITLHTQVFTLLCATILISKMGFSFILLGGLELNMGLGWAGGQWLWQEWGETVRGRGWESSESKKGRDSAGGLPGARPLGWNGLVEGSWSWAGAVKGLVKAAQVEPGGVRERDSYFFFLSFA